MKTSHRAGYWINISGRVLYARLTFFQALRLCRLALEMERNGREPQ